MAEIQIPEVRFQLSAIELQEVWIGKPAPGANQPTVFNFDLSIETNVEARQKLVINMVKVNIKGDESENQLGSITCVCIFSITDFKQFITTDDDGVISISPDLAEALNSVSVSTTRGVMFGEFKGTFLHHAVLPVIDIKALMRS